MRPAPSSSCTPPTRHIVCASCTCCILHLHSACVFGCHEMAGAHHRAMGEPPLGSYDWPAAPRALGAGTPPSSCGQQLACPPLAPCGRTLRGCLLGGRPQIWEVCWVVLSPAPAHRWAGAVLPVLVASAPCPRPVTPIPLPFARFRSPTSSYATAPSFFVHACFGVAASWARALGRGAGVRAQAQLGQLVWGALGGTSLAMHLL